MCVHVCVDVYMHTMMCVCVCTHVVCMCDSTLHISSYSYTALTHQSMLMLYGVAVVIVDDRKQLIALQKNHEVLRCPTK